MRKSVSNETVGVSFETVGIGIKQGDYREKSHKKCPEEHRAFWEALPYRRPNMCIVIDHQNRHADLIIHSYFPLSFASVCLRFWENKTEFAKSKVTQIEYGQIMFLCILMFLCIAAARAICKIGLDKFGFQCIFIVSTHQRRKIWKPVCRNGVIV